MALEEPILSSTKAKMSHIRRGTWRLDSSTTKTNDLLDWPLRHPITPANTHSEVDLAIARQSSSASRIATFVGPPVPHFRSIVLPTGKPKDGNSYSCFTKNTEDSDVLQ